MRAGVAIAAILSLSMTMVAVPATAFHGTPYVLAGTGSLAGLPAGIFDARLEWNGAGVFRLSIVEHATHISLVSTVIAGGESLPAAFLGAPQCAFLERVSPYVGFGNMFRAQGVQDNCLSNGQRYMHVTGTYSNIWSFDVSTGIPFG